MGRIPSRRLRRTAALAALASLVGCGHRVDLKEQDAAVASKRIVVEVLQYDAAGRPVVPPALGRRPSRTGDRFSVVHLERGRPVASFDVAVVDAADFERPLDALYEWTSKGVTWGLKASAVMARGLAQSPGAFNNTNNGAAAAAVLVAFVATPAIAGTAGGAVMGLADGARLSAGELAKLLRGPRERLISHTVYSYDARDRLVLMRLYSGGLGEELARTEFHYDGDAAVPARSEVVDLRRKAAN